MQFRYVLILLVLIWGCTENLSVSPDSGGGVSQGGSTAQFTVVGNYLYRVDAHNLFTYDISSETEIKEVHSLALDWSWFEVETIFPYADMLFLGTTGGVIIISIESPSRPVFLSEYEHIVACDPVVTDGKYAYVTLRTGTRCGGMTNELQIIDISNIQNPNIISSFTMTNPRGLAINGNTLYVCDAGIRIIDVSDPYNPSEINHLANIPANDLIYYNNRILVTADNGFYQFDVTDVLNINQIGQFSF